MVIQCPDKSPDMLDMSDMSDIFHLVALRSCYLNASEESSSRWRHIFFSLYPCGKVLNVKFKKIIMHRICINRHKTRLSKNFKRFWSAAATACQPQKTVFRASFTGCPSTVTFYEVKLQQLLLHQRHNFQKWCRNSRLAGSWSGRYCPPEGGGINRTCLKEQKPASAALRGFCFIFFLYLLSFAAFFSPHPPISFLRQTW